MLTGSRILVVDDDPEFRALVRPFLADMDYSVKEAADGRLALQLLSQNRFDAVILDVVMPECEGLESIQAIRKRGFGCPILATSGASSRSEYLRMARHLGAAAVLEKPVSREGLRATLQELLRTRSARGADTECYTGTVIDTLGRSHHSGVRDVSSTDRR